jgi:hypothetical protein
MRGKKRPLKARDVKESNKIFCIFNIYSYSTINQQDIFNICPVMNAIDNLEVAQIPHDYLRYINYTIEN